MDTGSSNLEPPEAAKELMPLVSHVYRSVWDEYSAWALGDSELTIRGLTTPSSARLPSLPQEPLSALPEVSEISEDFETFTITDLDADGAKQETFEVSSSVVTVDKALRPYPPYESCTPISRNVMVGDDPDFLPFIPFSDDPTYDHTFDIGEHKYFAWPSTNSDPDVEIIAHEATRRLLLEHNLSHEYIDQTEVLPFQIENIIKLPRKRDFPKWRSMKDLGPLPRPTSAPQGPREITNYLLSTFCSNMNCITGFCTTHLETQPPSVVLPKVPYAKLADAVQDPCGRDCFMWPISAENSVGTFWNTTDFQFLFNFLDYAPDSASCDLATICRKPCREVHRQRARYRSPALHADRSRNTGATTGAKSSRTYKEHSSEFTPALPCRHDGPCDSRSDCACAQNKAHCHMRCGCVKSCLRRWKGCSCAKSRSGKLCGTNKCSCFVANVECDPEVCIPCGARNDKSITCRNVSIQRGYAKRTEVRESKWGLGLFMLESCEEGELISEYVGELIYEPTFETRNAHTSHLGRSYVFKLNPTFSVDGANAGNATRYINHSLNANCGTTVCLVNGEHRVGIYAATRLEKGDELFINYGPKFFISSSGPQDAGAGASSNWGVPEGYTSNSVPMSLELPAFVMPTYEHASDATYSEESDVSMGDSDRSGSGEDG